MAMFLHLIAENGSSVWLNVETICSIEPNGDKSASARWRSLVKTLDGQFHFLREETALILQKIAASEFLART